MAGDNNMQALIDQALSAEVPDHHAIVQALLSSACLSIRAAATVAEHDQDADLAHHLRRLSERLEDTIRQSEETHTHGPH